MMSSLLKYHCEVFPVFWNDQVELLLSLFLESDSEICLKL